ncbi:MAG: hypothetical protein AAGU76_02735 [Sedimentibacter sp.]|uniref:hypothetical protein n=1 Tax=Sedimentibacter sp. TaxID=1960295 RepID=UPI003158F4C9
MIDLSILNNKTFDIRLKDGTELNIRKPSKELFNDTFKMIKLIEANSEEDKIIGVLYNFLARAFNRNTNGIKLTQQQVEDELELDVAMYVTKEYWKFVQEVMQDINF